MTAEPDLLPCPGCNGASVRVIGGPGAKGGPQYWAGCDYCRWRTWGNTEAEAIAAWNRRVTAEKDAEIEALRAEVERANGWNERVSVCRDHVADIVDGPCVICALDAAEARADKLRAEVGETKEVAVRAMRQRDAQYNRAERLAEALRNSANALERLAFAIPAPNVHTPQLAKLAIAMRNAAIQRTDAALDQEAGHEQ